MENKKLMGEIMKLPKPKLYSNYIIVKDIKNLIRAQGKHDSQELRGELKNKIELLHKNIKDYKMF